MKPLRLHTEGMMGLRDILKNKWDSLRVPTITPSNMCTPSIYCYSMGINEGEIDDDVSKVVWVNTFPT